MATLTDRAERAVLGAMITSPDQAIRLSYLHPGDLTGPRRQATLNAITRTAAIPGMNPEQRSQAITAAARHPEVTPGYLEQLQAACPDPAHGPAYAAMILQSLLARQMSARARELADQSRILAREARRVTTAGAAGGPAAETLATHLAHVAAALSSHAFRIGAAPARPAPAGPVFIPAPGTGPHTAPAHGPATAQHHREERVLAALLRGHRDTARILSFLPPTAFTTQPRRDIYQAIRALHAAGKPIDELTADWELGHHTQPHHPSGDTYTTRLARTTPGTQPVLDDATTLMTRLHHPAPASHTPTTGQPGQTATVIPLTRTPRPQTALIQPPPGSIPAQPGPAHRS